jgi:large subunit ribosomal protein L7/L12
MADEQAKSWSDQTKQLGDGIVKLTLMQAKELADYLKEVYGIEPAAGGAVMVAGPAAGGAAPAAAPTRSRSSRASAS